MIQCMGGWHRGRPCSSRELCAHYFARMNTGREPVERLCGAKEEPEAWYRQRLIPVIPEQQSREVAIRPCSSCLSTQTPVATVAVQFEAENAVTSVATNDM